MDHVGKDADTVRGRQPGVRFVLQGGDTGGPSIWIRGLRAVRRNDKDSGEHPCGFPTTYHRKARETAIWRVMGDTSYRGVATYGGYAVSGHAHMPPTGYGSTVGVPTTTNEGLRARNRI